MHLTETCALETTEPAQAHVLPQLITDVQTTIANVQDVEMTHVIQEDLARHHLLPDEQIVVLDQLWEAFSKDVLGTQSLWTDPLAHQ